MSSDEMMTAAKWETLKSITVAPHDITFPSIVLYYKESCGYCTRLIPKFLDVMEREGGTVDFFAVDIATHNDALNHMGLLLPEAQS